jgi:hypothetical protein
MTSTRQASRRNHLHTQFSSNKNKVADEACSTLSEEGRKLLCCVDKVCRLAPGHLRQHLELKLGIWEAYRLGSQALRED